MIVTIDSGLFNNKLFFVKSSDVKKKKGPNVKIEDLKTRWLVLKIMIVTIDSGLFNNKLLFVKSSDVKKKKKDFVLATTTCFQNQLYNCIYIHKLPVFSFVNINQTL